PAAVVQGRPAAHGPETPLLLPTSGQGSARPPRQGRCTLPAAGRIRPGTSSDQQTSAGSAPARRRTVTCEECALPGRPQRRRAPPRQRRAPPCRPRSTSRPPAPPWPTASPTRCGTPTEYPGTCAAPPATPGCGTAPPTTSPTTGP